MPARRYSSQNLLLGEKTAAVDDNTSALATTAFVIGQAGSASPIIDGAATVGVSTRFARQDHVHPTDTSRSPLASPTFTGTPAAPTAAVDTSTTQLATTAFVLAQAASATPLIDGTATVGVSTRFARGDHVHPTDTSRAPLASPTLTGTPAAPTAAAGTNTTQLATTAFVFAAVRAQGSGDASINAGTPTTSTSTIMAGLAGSIAVNSSGTVVFIVGGNVSSGGGTPSTPVQIAYGTGGAPGQGAAATGTVAGQKQQHNVNECGFCLVARVTGLTPGVTYWFDVQYSSPNGGSGVNSQVNNLTGVAIEK